MRVYWAEQAPTAAVQGLTEPCQQLILGLLTGLTWPGHVTWPASQLQARPRLRQWEHPMFLPCFQHYNKLYTNLTQQRCGAGVT